MAKHAVETGHLSMAEQLYRAKIGVPFYINNPVSTVTAAVARLPKGFVVETAVCLGHAIKTKEPFECIRVIVREKPDTAAFQSLS